MHARMQHACVEIYAVVRAFVRARVRTCVEGGILGLVQAKLQPCILRVLQLRKRAFMMSHSGAKERGASGGVQSYHLALKNEKVAGQRKGLVGDKECDRVRPENAIDDLMGFQTLNALKKAPDI